MTSVISIKQNTSDTERLNRSRLVELLQDTPIPDNELLENLPLYLNRQTLTLVLHMNELYQKILDVPGVIMEFGVRWGRNTAMLQNLRGVHEPYNHTRRIIGFDTFSGFTDDIVEKDGRSDIAKAGAYGVAGNYATRLRDVIGCHEKESPIDHIKKTEIVVGDVLKRLPIWLDEHPEALVAMAYFDLDVYRPTLECINNIVTRLTKGSVLVFDQLGYRDFPGEIEALRDSVLGGTDRVRLRRSRLAGHQSFIIWGD